MLELLALPFMQRALIAGVLVGAVAGYFGVFVVQRRMSFLGSGLAHGAFGGVALGLLLGVEPLTVAIPFVIAIAIAIVWVRERTRLGEDTVIGVLFSVAMAAGVIFLAVRRASTAEAMTYLFGSIVAVSRSDVVLAIALAAIAACTAPLWSRWSYATFDRELARADRLRPLRDDYILAICLAITVVACVKIVGIVLTAAFLVMPAATARLGSRTFAATTLGAMFLGGFTALAGLIASYFMDFPSGAVIVLFQAIVFGLNIRR